MDTLQNNWQWWLFSIAMLPLAVLFVQGVDVDNLTALQIFPYLGIFAWTVMWTHYASGLLRKKFELKPSKAYSKFSHLAVTAAFLLHPGLLALSQHNSSGTLPPDSFYSYVAMSARLAVLAGTISLLVFLSYDAYRWLQKLNKPFWKRQQWIVSLMQAAAMSLIFWHGLRLGQHLQSGWFKYWWVALGIVLLVGQYSDIKRALDKRFPQLVVSAV